MAAREARSHFVCQECGAASAKWTGRCSVCGEWNTLVEERVHQRPARAESSGGRGALRAAAQPTPLTRAGEAEAKERLETGIGEFDRVLGGGLVPGALVLLGGEPGIGKSTLLLQVASRFADRHGPVLYVTGEESSTQVRMRAQRLGAVRDSISVYPESSVEAVAAQVEESPPALLIVDSIQTAVTEALDSPAGSVGQVRESAAELMRLAKERSLPVILVGHVTKQGTLAGPKVLEHAVDVVLQFEGERTTAYRLLRSEKNRFGSTQELGIFEMLEEGLREVENPSASFLAERPAGCPGSAVVGGREGSRPLLVEVQALTGPTPYGGTPRRQVSGVDPHRASIVLAVLERRNALKLQTHDVFVNVAGGIRIDEPAADLGIAVAVASSFRDRPVDPHTVFFGEVGLAGEVRSVARAELRLREAARLGFKRCVMPKGNDASLKAAGIEAIAVATVAEALEAAML